MSGDNEFWIEWLKKEVWSIEEAACLVAGLEPLGHPAMAIRRSAIACKEDARRDAMIRAKWWSDVELAQRDIYLSAIDSFARSTRAGSLEGSFKNGYVNSKDAMTYAKTQFPDSPLAHRHTDALSKPLTAKERKSLLVVIGALCKELDIDPNGTTAVSRIQKLVEGVGMTLSNDTIRTHLRRTSEAVESQTDE